MIPPEGNRKHRHEAEGPEIQNGRKRDEILEGHGVLPCEVTMWDDSRDSDGT